MQQWHFFTGESSQGTSTRRLRPGLLPARMERTNVDPSAPHHQRSDDVSFFVSSPLSNLSTIDPYAFVTALTVCFPYASCVDAGEVHASNCVSQI